MTFKENSPAAGDYIKKHRTTAYLLAPLPLPTLLPPNNRRETIESVNGTYMVYGGGWPTAIALQIGFGLGMLTLFTFPFFTALLGAWDLYLLGTTLELVWQRWSSLFTAYAHFSPVAATLLFLVTFLARQISLQNFEHTIPPHFNRERREVCIMALYPLEPIFFPWEELKAWVQENVSYRHGVAIHDYKMSFGFLHTPSNETITVVSEHNFLEDAISQWEAIRAYMEYEYLNVPVMNAALNIHTCNDSPHEGLHTFYHAKAQMKRQFKARKVGVFYVMRWYLFHAMTLWTLPYRITEYDIRQLKLSKPKALPQALVDWSAPLPPEQWARPSAELREQSALVRELKVMYPEASTDELFAQVKAWVADRYN